MATITIQPDGATGIDTDVYEFQPNTARGTATSLFFITYAGGRRHTLIKFDLSSLAGYTITAATLYLTASGSYAGTLKIHRVLAANSGWTEGATWNYADGSSVRWAGDAAANGGTDAGCSISGTDYDAAEMGSLDLSATGGTETSAALDLTEFAALIANNYGIFIRTTSTSALPKFAYSSDYGTAGYRPKLVVEYMLAGKVYVRGVEFATRPVVDGKIYTYGVSTVAEPVMGGAISTYNVGDV